LFSFFFFFFFEFTYLQECFFSEREVKTSLHGAPDYCQVAESAPVLYGLATKHFGGMSQEWMQDSGHVHGVREPMSLPTASELLCQQWPARQQGGSRRREGGGGERGSLCPAPPLLEAQTAPQVSGDMEVTPSHTVSGSQGACSL
jgi:hypothetical protein